MIFYLKFFFYQLFPMILVTVQLEVSYRNFRVYRIYPQTRDQIYLLQNLENHDVDISFWEGPSLVNVSVDLMIPPEIIPEFTNLMNSHGLNYKLYIKDVQKLINSESKNKSNLKLNNFFNWEQYHTLDEIYDWLEVIQEEFPENVQVIQGGRSFEGRPILGVKLFFSDGNPGVFIEGGIHAREWISPATVTYLIHKFLIAEDPEIKNFSRKYDWYMFPVCNPDGYVYTYTTNRLWRKNRRPITDKCYGVDLNRNWGYKWQNGGASQNPCHGTYAGPSAFSEIETRSLSQYIKSISHKLFAYISFHSYSQVLMFPYGHTKEKLDNYEESRGMAKKAVAALSERYGTQYRYGNIVETLYIATGGSIDWVKAIFKLPAVFIYELRDRGRSGFLLPPEEIIPNGQEILDSLLALFREAENYGYTDLNRGSFDLNLNIPVRLIDLANFRWWT